MKIHTSVLMKTEQTNRSMRVKTKKRGASAMPRLVVREGEKNLTLVFDSVYHIMDSTCIHMRIKDLNIYMYRRERIYKEPTREIQ
jgi:hypothetical protein